MSLIFAFSFFSKTVYIYIYIALKTVLERHLLCEARAATLRQRKRPIALLRTDCGGFRAALSWMEETEMLLKIYVYDV